MQWPSPLPAPPLSVSPCPRLPRLPLTALPPALSPAELPQGWRPLRIQALTRVPPAQRGCAPGRFKVSISLSTPSLPFLLWVLPSISHHFIRFILLEWPKYSVSSGVTTWAWPCPQRGPAHSDATFSWGDVQERWQHQQRVHYCGRRGAGR